MIGPSTAANRGPGTGKARVGNRPQPRAFVGQARGIPHQPDETGSNSEQFAMALSFLDRERTVARPGFNRWMVPPAALCMHLCIGQAYAFSVFNLPMTKLIGITQSAPGDWKLTELGWIFSIAMFFLGTSAAV